MLQRFFFCVFCTVSISIAQPLKKTVVFFQSDSLPQRPVREIKKNRLLVATTGIIAANVAVYQPFKEAWWTESRTGFHFYRGYKRTSGAWDFGWSDSYYGHLDKLGHFYSSKLISELLSDIGLWVGYKPANSRKLGAAVSFLLMSEIEVYDSFFQEWGFSLADFTANAIGAYVPLITDRFPFLNRFNLKLSFHPSGYYRTERNYIKDYEGMTFWLTYDIHRDLPSFLTRWWPDFINLSVGYGVDQQEHGNVELYIAPDINLSKLIKCNGVIGKIIYYLDYIHLPLCAWKIAPRSRFYPIYF